MRSKNRGILFLTYIFLGLTIGEFHPFSKFPMYNNLPKWSYVFYYTDVKEKLIPANKFQNTGNGIGHIFYAVCENMKIQFGNNKETKLELYEIGENMTKVLIGNKINLFDSIQDVKLYRLNMFVNDSDSIIIDTVLMYQTKLNELVN